MPETPEHWGVGTRKGALAAINQYVRDSTSAFDLVVFYPGSGADISHPLFSTYSRARYFIFVDILATLEGSLDTAIRSPFTKIEAEDLRPHLERLEIDPQTAPQTPPVGWQFRFKGADRFVLLFRGGSQQFLERNRRFSYHVFFDKDFWETSEIHSLGLVLKRLRACGFFITNMSVGAYEPFLEDLGLRRLTTVELNGPQYVWQKIAPTPTDADKTPLAIEKGRQAVESLLFVDPEYWIEDHSHWTGENWRDVMGDAMQAARKAILEEIRMDAPLIWDASECVILEALDRIGVKEAHRAHVAAAKRELKRTWPNITALVARARALILEG